MNDSRLLRAGSFGDVAVIGSIVAAGVDEHGTPLLEARNKGNTRLVDQALVNAAEHGSVQAVELLLASGADLHAGDDEALRKASRLGHAVIVQLLIQHGANVGAHDSRALHWASANGRVDVMQVLLQHGARSRLGRFSVATGIVAWTHGRCAATSPAWGGCAC